jgi:ribosomal protein S18 acetylase RimI-like enzyme
MIHREPFTAALISEVQEFHCGDDEWALDLADWLRDPRSDVDADTALAALADEDLNCQVWVWRNETGAIVGFGSLGDTDGRVPNPNKGPRIPITIIPALAVHADHQGKGYGLAILEELLDLASQRADERPFVILMVHVDNRAAQALYRRMGFANLGKPFLERETGWMHQKMYYDLLERRKHSTGIP